MSERTQIFNVFFIVTERCNIFCRACGYWRNKEPKMMELDVVDRVLPYMARNRIQSATWTGGEPTLHPALPEMFRRAHEYNIDNTLITHGVGLRNNSEVLSPFLDHVILSLDGPDRETYRKIRGVDAFDELVGLPAYLRNTVPGIGVATCFLIQKFNIDRILDFIELANLLGVDRLAFLVPDIQGYQRPASNENSFGRFSPSKHLLGSILPTLEQLDTFERQLPELTQACKQASFDSPTSDLLASYLDYFRAFYGRQPYRRPTPCPALSHEAVITVDGYIRPCFFVQEKYSIESERDPFFSEEIGRQRIRLAEDDSYRDRHCRNCLQTARGEAP